MRTNARVAVACFFLMSAVYAGAVVSSCAHVPSPGQVVACLANPQDEKAAENIVYSLLDGNDTAALALALSAAPDVVRCLLQRAEQAVGAGGVEGARARKAREFLDAHPPTAMEFEGPAGDVPAARVGARPHGGPTEGSPAVGSPPTRGLLTEI